MELTVLADPTAVAKAAAAWLRERVSAAPDLVLAAPAGRRPRPMYRALAAQQNVRAVDFSRLHLFAVDDLCPPAPVDGLVWRQVRRDFLRLATGPLKRELPRRLLEGPVTPDVPASVLPRHPRCRILADREAAP